MNILADVTHIYPFHLAGSEVSLFQTLRWFVRAGHKVTIMTSKGQPMEIDGVNYLINPLEGVRRALYCKADVVVTQLDRAKVASKTARETNRPIVQFVHKLQTLTDQSLVDADLTILNAYWLLARPRDFHGPVTVLNPPVFLSDYAFKPNRDIEPASNTMVNLSIAKGAKLFWRLAEANPRRSFSGVLGAYGEQVSKKSLQCTTHHNTLDLKTIFEHTRVLLVPSLRETYGRVALEAMWGGIPVIANSMCQMPGLQEALGDAVLWTPRTDKPDEDTVAWSEALDRLDDPHLYRELQLRGYARAAQQADLAKSQLVALERQFQSLVNMHQRSRVHFFAKEIHYLEHLTPTAHQVHPDRLGAMVVPKELELAAVREGHRVVSYDVRKPGASAGILHGIADPCCSLVLAVSKADQALAEKLSYPVVRAEHGVGQTYLDGDQSGSYAGSPDHARLFAYHAVGVHGHARQMQACPHVLSQRVGSPWLDRLNPRTFLPEELETAAVGFCFHWDNGLRPETKATWREWLPEAFKQLGARVRVTAHPREAEKVKNFLRETGNSGAWLGSLAEMHATCGIVCADNTSALYLLAALGHPVVVLNRPTYRKEVEHGLRFWEAADVGIQCERLVDLKLSAEAWEDPMEEDVLCRESALDYVFYRRQGASIVEALLLENYLAFRQAFPEKLTTERCVALQSFDSGELGPILKGRSYQIPADQVSVLVSRNLVRALGGERMAMRAMEVEYKMGNKPRQSHEALLRVEKGFKFQDVTYKPGDLVPTSALPEEKAKEFCRKYEPKTRQTEMETK